MKLRSPRNPTFMLTFTFMSALCVNEAFGAPVDLSESFTYQGRFLSSDGSSALTEALSL